jgi:hypothetical protein
VGLVFVVRNVNAPRKDGFNLHALAAPLPAADGQRAQRVQQFRLGRARLNQRGKRHIARDSADTVQIEQSHSVVSTSCAARSPDSIAPSIYPIQRVAVSVPAQKMRPTGSRSARPNCVHTPGGKCAP